MNDRPKRETMSVEEATIPTHALDRPRMKVFYLCALTDAERLIGSAARRRGNVGIQG
jgi:hypothetical protein